jgi:DNA polymerase III delta subunit
MLYVIHGTDIDKAREKSRALFDALREKKPDASAGEISAETVTADKIEELTQTQGLFENKQIVFMDRTLENKDVREVILDKIDAIAESPNIFIFFEGKLTKEVLKKLEKRAEKITEYEADDAPKKPAESLFPMADALANRDKKSLWVMLRRALDDEAAPEEVHGILFWQAKSLALAAKSANAAEAGLNPFVFSKAKRAAANFKAGEIDMLVSNLVSMYHRAHRGEIDFAIELEKLALDI